jgi:hypothetical protein
MAYLGNPDIWAFKNNKTQFINPLWNGQIYEPVPEILINDKLYTQEEKLIFDRLSSLFSNIPNIIFQILLNNTKLPYQPVSQNLTYTDPSKIVSYNDNDYSLQDLESKYMIRINTQFPENSEGIRTSLNDFFKDTEKKIFVGFIKIGPKKIFGMLPFKRNIAGHMNSFIINKETKEIIRYEPKGAFIKIPVSYWTEFDLKKHLMNILKNNSLLANYKLVNTTNFKIEQITPQFYDIYCQTYSLYAALLYCLNQHQSDNVLNLFATMTKSKAIAFQKYFYVIIAKNIGITNLDQTIINKLLTKDAIYQNKLLQDVNFGEQYKIPTPPIKSINNGRRQYKNSLNNNSQFINITKSSNIFTPGSKSRQIYEDYQTYLKSIEEKNIVLNQQKQALENELIDIKDKIDDIKTEQNKNKEVREHIKKELEELTDNKVRQKKEKKTQKKTSAISRIVTRLTKKILAPPELPKRKPTPYPTKRKQESKATKRTQPSPVNLRFDF